MDPKQALIDAENALTDGKHRAARRSLRAYRDWRANGGFEPRMHFGLDGDVLYERLVSILREREAGLVWMKAGLGR